MPADTRLTARPDEDGQGQPHLNFTWLSSTVPAGRYKLGYRINNKLCIFIQSRPMAGFPAEHFSNSATSTNAQPL